jgi:phosphoketolase
VNMTKLLQKLGQKIKKFVKMDEKKFKTVKNDGFGASKLPDLSVGDLVSWNSWTDSLDTGIFEAQSGLLIDIFKEDRIHGWGYMAKIMPFGGEKEVIIPLISLKKMEKGD